MVGRVLLNVASQIGIGRALRKFLFPQCTGQDIGHGLQSPFCLVRIEDKPRNDMHRPLLITLVQSHTAPPQPCEPVFSSIACPSRGWINLTMGSWLFTAPCPHPLGP